MDTQSCQNNPSTPAWQALEQHAQIAHNWQLNDLFAAEADRFSQFSVSFNDLLLDYSKNFIDAKTRYLLCTLADNLQLTDHIDALFSGKPVNFTEHVLPYTPPYATQIQRRANMIHTFAQPSQKIYNI